MPRVLADLYPEKVFYYFEQISAIPRGSGNVKKIADYLCFFGFFRTVDDRPSVSHIGGAFTGSNPLSLKVVCSIHCVFDPDDVGECGTVHRAHPHRLGVNFQPPLRCNRYHSSGRFLVHAEIPFPNHFTPVEPKPPSPRTVSSSSSHTSKAAVR